MAGSLLMTAAITGLLSFSGCVGIEESLPDDDGGSERSPAPGADVLQGEDEGVSFDYRGGSVTVDISRSSRELRRQVIGEKVVVDCGGGDQSRRWPGSAGSELIVQLTREGVAPRDVQTEIRSCRIAPVPGTPLAVAPMRPADGDRTG